MEAKNINFASILYNNYFFIENLNANSDIYSKVFNILGYTGQTLKLSTTIIDPSKNIIHRLKYIFSDLRIELFIFSNISSLPNISDNSSSVIMSLYLSLSCY